jgi:hypothetical protein
MFTARERLEAKRIGHFVKSPETDCRFKLSSLATDLLEYETTTG